MAKNIVVSAPRSGLNWIRYCVETFAGVKTPGKTSLLPGDENTQEAFLRTHDALGWTRRRRHGAWQNIPRSEAQQAKVSLVLRDPLESYVRMADSKLRNFGCYVGNIRFLSRCQDADVRVFYYEDLTTNPETMMSLLDFLDLKDLPGSTGYSLEVLRGRWDELAESSRNMYDVKQAVGGGSKTKKAPRDFKFHQKRLSEQDKRRVFNFLRCVLTEEEYRLLERYDVPPYDDGAESALFRSARAVLGKLSSSRV